MHLYLLFPDPLKELIKLREGYNLRAKFPEYKWSDLFLSIPIVRGLEHLFGKRLSIDHHNPLLIQPNKRGVDRFKIQIPDACRYGRHFLGILDLLEEQFPEYLPGLFAGPVPLPTTALRDVLMEIIEKVVVKVDVADQAARVHEVGDRQAVLGVGVAQDVLGEILAIEISFVAGVEVLEQRVDGSAAPQLLQQLPPEFQ